METTRVPISELPFMPRYLGETFYPAGFPVPNESFSVTTGETGEGRTLRERITDYYLLAIDDESNLVENPPISEEDFEVLRQWVIYYVHAPMFLVTAELQRQALAISTWYELKRFLHVALEEAGLDIF